MSRDGPPARKCARIAARVERSHVMTCNIAQFFSQHLGEPQRVLYRHFVSAASAATRTSRQRSATKDVRQNTHTLASTTEFDPLQPLRLTRTRHSTASTWDVWLLDHLVRAQQQ